MPTTAPVPSSREKSVFSDTLFPCPLPSKSTNIPRFRLRHGRHDSRRAHRLDIDTEVVPLPRRHPPESLMRIGNPAVAIDRGLLYGLHAALHSEDELPRLLFNALRDAVSERL